MYIYLTQTITPINISLINFQKVHYFLQIFKILIFDCAGSVAMCRLSLVTVHGHLIEVASLVAAHSSRARGLQQLWHMGLVALWHVESSWTRDQTCVPCIGRQIFNHWTTREVQTHSFICSFSSLFFHFLLQYHSDVASSIVRKTLPLTLFSVEFQLEEIMKSQCLSHCYVDILVHATESTKKEIQSIVKASNLDDFIQVFFQIFKD